MKRFAKNLSVNFLSFLVLAAVPALQVQAQVPAPQTQTLVSGIKILHTTVGTGAMPVATDRVKVHYRGTLPSGVEFDNSYKEGSPAVFPLNKVIRCWTQALQHMKVGGKATLSCPAELAYGAKGAGTTIPPNTALTFDVELLGIEK